MTNHPTPLSAEQLDELAKRVNFVTDKFGSPVPYSSEHGQYVRFADYATLLAEVRQLRADADKRVQLYEQVERAAGELPHGWEIRLCVERGLGTVELWDEDGCEVDFPTNCERLDYTMSDAIDAAINQGGK